MIFRNRSEYSLPHQSKGQIGYSPVGKVEASPLGEEAGCDVGPPVEERDVDLDVGLVGSLGRLELAEADGDVATRRVPQVHRGGGRQRLGGAAILGGGGKLEANFKDEAGMSAAIV